MVLLQRVAELQKTALAQKDMILLQRVAELQKTALAPKNDSTPKSGWASKDCLGYKKNDSSLLNPKFF